MTRSYRSRCSYCSDRSTSGAGAHRVECSYCSSSPIGGGAREHYAAGKFPETEIDSCRPCHPSRPCQHFYPHLKGART